MYLRQRTAEGLGTSGFHEPPCSQCEGGCRKPAARHRKARRWFSCAGALNTGGGTATAMKGEIRLLKGRLSSVMPRTTAPFRTR